MRSLHGHIKTKQAAMWATRYAPKQNSKMQLSWWEINRSKN
jgi:hypothetical protein